MDLIIKVEISLTKHLLQQELTFFPRRIKLVSKRLIILFIVPEILVIK